MREDNVIFKIRFANEVRELSVSTEDTRYSDKLALMINNIREKHADFRLGNRFIRNWRVETSKFEVLDFDEWRPHDFWNEAFYITTDTNYLDGCPIVSVPKKSLRKFTPFAKEPHHELDLHGGFYLALSSDCMLIHVQFYLEKNTDEWTACGSQHRLLVEATCVLGDLIESLKLAIGDVCYVRHENFYGETGEIVTPENWENVVLAEDDTVKIFVVRPVTEPSQAKICPDFVC